MSKALLHAVRLALFGALVVWVLLAIANRDGTLALVARTLSIDGHIQDPSYALYMGGAMLLALALVGPAAMARSRAALADLARSRRWAEFSEVLLIVGLVAVHAIGTALYGLSAYPMQGIYREDGLLENATVLLALGAAVLLLIGRRRADRPTQGFAILLALVAVVFAGEEVSWGQRVFGIEPSGLFAQANYQGETNLHNFFNPALRLIFTLLNFAVAIWLLNARAATRWLVARFGCADIAPLVNPHNNLVLAFAIFALGLHCAIYGSELSEEVLALMLFYGSLRFMLARRAGSATTTSPAWR